MSNYIYYWDACIFISWLKDENPIKGLLEGINEIKEALDKKDATLVTSVITFTEVIQGNISDDSYSKFLNLFKRPNIVAYNVDENIATLAGRLRNYHKGKNLHKLKTVDAIHLATSATLKVNEINTFDGYGKKSGMLDYNGVIIDNYEFKIQVPQPKQQPLFSSIKPKTNNSTEESKERES